MQNKMGIIGGFALGAAGFLFLFKVLALPRIAPSDELAPGMVVIAAMIVGLIFAYIGSRVQNYLANKKN